MSTVARHLFLALLLTSACNDELPRPQVFEVRPSSGGSDQTPVEIIGAGFLVIPRSNFNEPSKARSNTTFIASLGDTALTDLTFSSSERLTATVPAGLSPGDYDLELRDPDGRLARLASAFTVLGPGPRDGGPDAPDLGSPDGSPDVGPALESGVDAVLDAPPPDAPQPDALQPDALQPDAPLPDQTTAKPIGMAIWRSAGTTAPIYSIWNGAGFSPIAKSTAVANLRIMTAAESPTQGVLGAVFVMGVSDTGMITGALWNGSAWSTIAPLNSTPVSETYWWGCDVAYEQNSGNAVVVWNNNTATAPLMFAARNSSSWIAKGAVSGYTGAEPQHMHLASKPGADEMVLVVNDSNADHRAVVWNGSTWGNALLLDSSGTAESDQSALHVAYEQKSGRAMVVYGKNNNSNVYYRLWNGAAWSAEGTITAPPTLGTALAQTVWLRLAADPNSNRLVLGVLTTGGTAADAWLAIWSGSSWGSKLVAETTATGSIFPNVDVAFEAKSGQALAAYGEAKQLTIRYRTATAGGSWSSEQIGPSVGGVPSSMTLDSSPASDDIMLSVLNSSGNLRAIRWNGSSWGTVHPLATSTGEVKNQPFVFVWDAP